MTPSRAVETRQHRDSSVTLLVCDNDSPGNPLSHSSSATDIYVCCGRCLCIRVFIVIIATYTVVATKHSITKLASGN